MAATTTPITFERSAKGRQPLAVAYVGVWSFMLVYCLRPQDLISGMGTIPIAKIAGILALGSFCFSILTQPQKPERIPKELIALGLLFGQLVLSIPFSIWKGGSFQLVMFTFSEVVLMTVAISYAANTLTRLRRLIFVHCSSVAIVAALSILDNHRIGKIYSRMSGAVGGVLDNPNDIAISLALVFPFCVVFLLRARGIFRKLVWIAMLITIFYTVVVTYSRSGLLALLTGALFCIWEFGIKGRRYSLVGGLLLGALALGIVGGPTEYGQRVASIFAVDSDPTGSAQQRRDLLELSIQTTFEHPLLGIGAGQFSIVSGNWHDTHNTYTQYSAEDGIPALLLFLFIFGSAFQNTFRAQRIAPGNAEVVLFGRALRASIAAYLVGAFFENTAYHFFTYFLVAYAIALLRIARNSEPSRSEAESRRPRGTPSRQIGTPESCAQIAWTGNRG